MRSKPPPILLAHNHNNSERIVVKVSKARRGLGRMQNRRGMSDLENISYLPAAQYIPYARSCELQLQEYLSPRKEKLGAPRIERGTFRIQECFSLLLSQLSYAPYKAYHQEPPLSTHHSLPSISITKGQWSDAPYISLRISHWEIIQFHESVSILTARTILTLSIIRSLSTTNQRIRS